MIIEEKIILDDWVNVQKHIEKLADKYDIAYSVLESFDGGIVGWRLEKDDSGYHLHVIYEENAMAEHWSMVNKCDVAEAFDYMGYNTMRALPYEDHNLSPIIISLTF